jgi:hypothetical protein
MKWLLYFAEAILFCQESFIFCFFAGQLAERAEKQAQNARKYGLIDF